MMGRIPCFQRQLRFDNLDIRVCVYGGYVRYWRASFVRDRGRYYHAGEACEASIIPGDPRQLELAGVVAAHYSCAP